MKLVLQALDRAAFITLLGLLALLSLTAAAQETPPPPSNAQQFEQWLQKNGYGETTPPSPPPGVAAPAVNPSTPPVVIQQRPSDSPPSLERQQQSMLDSLPSNARQASPESQKAFELLLRQNMPLTPEQVIQLRQQVDLAQRAAAVPPNVPPKPVSTTIMINLAPGGTPPAVRLAQGYVTSLVFVDSSGAPWPVAAYEIGNPKATNIQWDGKSNILLLQAVTPYSDGNLVIRLSNLPTPITLQLVSGQRVVDFRVDLHVAGVGPNAKEVPIGVSLPATTNTLLLNILDGVAPPGGKTLMVKGGDCQAWLVDGRMYLRTRYTVLSPGWIGKMTSSDGMQAYEMPRSASILVSRYGEPVELRVEGF